MARPFSFDNAAFHFLRTDGPPGFLLKHLIVYAIGIIVIAVLSFYAFRPILEAYVQAFAMISQGASEAQVQQILGEELLGNLGRVGLGYLGMLVVYAVFWSMMECAVLRRYVREEGYSIGWGDDEWRMLVIGLIWMASVIAAYIALIIGMLILIAPISLIAGDNPALAGLWGVIVVIALLLVWLYFAVRLSPAGAMTISDRKVAFFDAWGATKGRFWPLLGAFIVLGLILYVGILILYFVGAFAVLGAALSGMDLAQVEQDPDAVLGAFASPAVWIPIALIYFAMLVYQGFWQYAWAGIPSLAAKTDPRTGGMHDAADNFT